jgi:hypothetical protein
MLCSSRNLPTAERGPVQTYQIDVSEGRDRVNEIRSELFVFPEILEVFIAGRPDSLVVVCQGRPRPAEWLRALRAVGYELAPRSHPGTPAAKAGQTVVAAPLRRGPPTVPRIPADYRRHVLRPVV